MEQFILVWWLVCGEQAGLPYRCPDYSINVVEFNTKTACDEALKRMSERLKKRRTTLEGDCMSKGVAYAKQIN